MGDNPGGKQDRSGWDTFSLNPHGGLYGFLDIDGYSVTNCRRHQLSSALRIFCFWIFLKMPILEWFIYELAEQCKRSCSSGAAHVYVQVLTAPPTPLRTLIVRNLDKRQGRDRGGIIGRKGEESMPSAGRFLAGKPPLQTGWEHLWHNKTEISVRTPTLYYIGSRSVGFLSIICVKPFVV